MAKRVVVDALADLASLAGRDSEAAAWAVCTFWGELGLKCLCTKDERTRDVGVGLLEGLTAAQPRFPPAALQPAADAALAWLQAVCGHEAPAAAEGGQAAAAGLGSEDEGGGDDDDAAPVPGAEGACWPWVDEAKASEALAKRLDACALKDGEKLSALLLTVHHALLHVGRDQAAAQVAALWFGTALRCLRCVGKYPVREMGLVLVQEAVRMHASAHANAYAAAAKVTTAPALVF